MDKTVQRYNTLDDMKRHEYREWQRLSAVERFVATAELSIGAYQLIDPHGGRLA